MSTKGISSQHSTADQNSKTDLDTINGCQNNYRHTYVVIEHEEGKPIPVSLEMLGEARRLMDNFNKKYLSNERVVAVVLGK